MTDYSVIFNKTKTIAKGTTGDGVGGTENEIDHRTHLHRDRFTGNAGSVYNKGALGGASFDQPF